MSQQLEAAEDEAAEDEQEGAATGGGGGAPCTISWSLKTRSITSAAGATGQVGSSNRSFLRRWGAAPGGGETSG